MNHGRLSQIIAWLISLYAVEVLVPVIDIFELPLPRYVASMSFSVGFILAAFMMLIPMARKRQIPLLGNVSIALIGILVFWSGLEVIGMMAERGHMRFVLILDWIPLLMVILATRLHLRLFGEPQLLVSTLILTASLLVLVHTVLLLAVSVGMMVPLVNVDELVGRNGMTLLLPVGLWLLAFFPLKDWPVFGYRYNLLLVLALTNTILSEARAGLLILTWCVVVGIILRIIILRRWLRVSIIPLGLLIVIMSVFAYPILHAVGDQAILLMGQGDDAISIWSRAETNLVLIQKLAQNPILGLGGKEVAATKVFGYMGHTLFVNALAAYGILGALPVVWLLIMGVLGAREADREIIVHFLFLAIVIASVTNNVFAYFGVVIALIEITRTQDVKKELEKHSRGISYSAG